jgi:hypothetical protein
MGNHRSVNLKAGITPLQSNGCNSWRLDSNSAHADEAGAVDLCGTSVISIELSFAFPSV